MNIRDIVIQILEENGIEIDDKGGVMNVESLNFISAIVEIEQKFDIDFFDEFLELGKFDTVDDFVRVITYIKQK